MLEPTEAVPHRQPSTAGVVYYAANGIYVTDRLFVCAGRKVALSRLTNVHTVRSPLPAIAINAAIVAGAVGVVLIVVGGMLDTAGWLGGLVVLAVPATVALVGLGRPRSYELWADIASDRGTAPTGSPVTVRVLLLRCHDAERYHQICRALVRAQERSRS